MIFDIDNYLAHYGILRKSGRYPWGSGDSERILEGSFLDVVDKLRSEGLSDPEIAKGFGTTTTRLRAARSIESNERRQNQINEAVKLRAKGMSATAIGQKMGINESSVRSLLVASEKDKSDSLATISGMLKKNVDEKGFIDVGAGVENQLGISDTRLKTAVAMLQEKGYEVHPVQIDQLGTTNKTTIRVLAKPGTTYRDAKANIYNVRQISDVSEDGGRTFEPIRPPKSIDSKRVHVRYAEDGGKDADGVIYVRPGVPDVSLGNSRYAQVRIAVDDTHFLKGMAVYKDDLPDGVDLMFNTNKSNTGNKLDAMKPLKDEVDNPFGSITRQREGSVMNIVGMKEGSGEEGGWDQWSKSLPSQLLSKQSPKLAKQQLDMTFERKKQELDEIKALTNPAVRKKLLEAYADGADSSAVHLKAAALPRQATKVIMPVPSIKPDQVYAPSFRDGERVALVRFPHGGTFEIPELTVNNRHRESQKLLGKQAKDAIGIHPKVAERLSGADFDGDTVVVIPNNNRQIRSTPALQGLKGFDHQAQYKGYEGMPKMDARTKGIQMGLVSNLITDMTIKGAGPDELARAVKHSMVVIDAEKHGLNYKQSALDHGIKQLAVKYQGRPQGGASTLISRASGQVRVPDHKPRSPARGGPIDPKTGKKRYEDEPESYRTRDGKLVIKTRVSKKLAETDDAYTLVDDRNNPIEDTYASHSNRMKGLANEARKEVAAFKPPLISKSAKTAYPDEVKTLNAKLNLARQNKPLERQAQVFANATLAQKRAANPHMTKDEVKKAKFQALATARARVQADKQKIVISPKEWAAIQAGAISNHQLNQILNHADLDVIKELATPRTTTSLSATKATRARTMYDSGYTQAEIADALGVSPATLSTVLE